MKNHQKLIGAAMIITGAAVSYLGSSDVSADIASPTPAVRIATVYLVAGILLAMAGVVTLALAYVKS